MARCGLSRAAAVSRRAGRQGQWQSAAGTAPKALPDLERQVQIKGIMRPALNYEAIPVLPIWCTSQGQTGEAVSHPRGLNVVGYFLKVLKVII